VQDRADGGRARNVVREDEERVVSWDDAQTVALAEAEEVLR
jgi:hypothetical protein